MEQQSLNGTEKPSLIKMFWSPGEQLERVKNSPKIWLPLVIVTIFYFLASVITAMTLTVEDYVNQGVPAEQAELILQGSKMVIIVSGFLTPIIVALISALIYFVIIKIAKKAVTFKQLFSMTVYIMIIGAVGILLNGLIQWAIGGDPTIYVTSLAGLLGSNSLVLSQFEVFSIWQLILTVIGLQKVGQLSKGASWTIVIIFFLIGIGFGMIGSMLEGIGTV